jgi:hypothetical protein
LVKIIETNLSVNEDKIMDHQSRIIEVDSWEGYIKEIKEGYFVLRNGSMYGATLPKDSKVYSLRFDSFHLSYSIYDRLGRKTTKLAYLINN